MLTLGTTVTKAALQWRGSPVFHNLIFMWTHPWVPPGENGSPPHSKRHLAHLTFIGKRLSVSSYQKHVTYHSLCKVNLSTFVSTLPFLFYISDDFIVVRFHCRRCCLWHCVHHYSLTVVCVFIMHSSQPWTGEWHHKPWSWTVSCKPHKHTHAHTLVCTCIKSNLSPWVQTSPVQCVCELVVDYLYKTAFQGFTAFLFLWMPVESTIWGLIAIQLLTVLTLPQLGRLRLLIEAMNTGELASAFKMFTFPSAKILYGSPGKMQSFWFVWITQGSSVCTCHWLHDATMRLPMVRCRKR